MEYEEAQKLYDFRMKNLREAQNFVKPKKIPLVANMQNWLYLDTGTSTAETTRDYAKYKQCQRTFVERYPNVDYFGGGLRNPFRVPDSMGSDNSNVYASNDITQDNINAIVEDLIGVEDYDEIISGNLNGVLWKALFKRFPDAANFSPKQMANSVKEMYYLNTANADIVAMLKDEYGVLTTKTACWVLLFFTNLMSDYRGIKAVSIDLRRCPEKVQAACDIITQPITDQAVKTVRNGKYGPDYNLTSECYASMTGQTILNYKNFKKLCFKYWKPVLDACDDMGKTFAFFSQGDWARVGDLFNDYKKGTVAMAVETEDPFEIRRKFPNICIYGGLQVDIMGQKSTQECIDMAKKAIDELGVSGGLVLQPNKMVTYRYDMKSENLKAVSDFVNEYQ